MEDCPDCEVSDLVATYFYDGFFGRDSTSFHRKYVTKRDHDPTYKDWARIMELWSCPRGNYHHKSPSGWQEPYNLLPEARNKMRKKIGGFEVTDRMAALRCTCCQCLYCRIKGGCNHGAAAILPDIFSNTPKRRNSQFDKRASFSSSKSKASEDDAIKKRKADLDKYIKRHSKAMKNLGNTVGTLGIRRQSMWFEKPNENISLEDDSPAQSRGGGGGLLPPVPENLIKKGLQRISSNRSITSILEDDEENEK